MSNFLKDLRLSIFWDEKPYFKLLKLFLVHGIPYFFLYWGFESLLNEEVELGRVFISSFLFGVFMSIANQYTRYKQAQKELAK